MQQQHFPFEILLQPQHGLSKDGGILMEEAFHMAPLELMLDDIIINAPQLLSSSTASSTMMTAEEPVMAPVPVKKTRPRRPPLSECVVDADNEGKVKEIRIAGTVYLEEDASVISDVSDDEDEDDEEDGYEYDDDDVSTLSSQGTVPLSISIDFQL
mmetsp:Transcript_27082/g.45136  ORF Transcript_27082/g.45136 Transcript_27082/m.45136 type:complete len:156 (+) Transcript_27082:888-1355(+)|eukprot:CAMPEP_0119003886 /NCGR_PEP_ID=MMETSP1176-20130426/819_1 /TAXON_ID=265551 /ORGANISM="Synedropsis recta cf, Strain CCMP1620" /LENGTH=155 /DNA_ID=CAMNT_0006955527 /DNA_START=884 /DNA_END=1351 /DNA_ORIENTATION=-